MSFFKSLFQDLFSKEELSPDQEESPLVSEQIIRTDAFCSDFKKWKSLGILKSMLNHANEQWSLRYRENNKQVNFQLHLSKLSNGFYFRSEEPWDNEDYSFLIHYWIDRLKSKGYVLKRAQREVCEEGGLLKGLEEFYLKPGLKYRRSTPYEQFFGNIHIEHRMVDGETKLVKLLANTYSDRTYKTAYDFEDLIHFILVL